MGSERDEVMVLARGHDLAERIPGLDVNGDAIVVELERIGEGLELAREDVDDLALLALGFGWAEGWIDRCHHHVLVDVQEGQGRAERLGQGRSLLERALGQLGEIDGHQNPRIGH